MTKAEFSRRVRAGMQRARKARWFTAERDLPVCLLPPPSTALIAVRYGRVFGIASMRHQALKQEGPKTFSAGG